MLRKVDIKLLTANSPTLEAYNLSKSIIDVTNFEVHFPYSSASAYISMWALIKNQPTPFTDFQSDVKLQKTLSLVTICSNSLALPFKKVSTLAFTVRPSARCTYSWKALAF